VDYNLLGHGPERPDQCDVCGGRLVQREDDNPDALAARLRDYHAKTQPIIELFERKEFVARVDASRPIPTVQAEIRSRLGLALTDPD
jgi:adenylate kinase